MKLVRSEKRLVGGISKQPMVSLSLTIQLLKLVISCAVGFVRTLAFPKVS